MGRRFFASIKELFQIIEDRGNADAFYEPRRQSERFGKTLLWMITESDTVKQTMMFAEDYDEVLRRIAEDDDINLLDERSKHIIRMAAVFGQFFYIRGRFFLHHGEVMEKSSHSRTRAHAAPRIALE